MFVWAGEVVFLHEEDKIANKMGVKGIGELGITSIAASIANAIFSAPGKRMRDLPITPEKLIEAGMEAGVTAESFIRMAFNEEVFFAVLVYFS